MLMHYLTTGKGMSVAWKRVSCCLNTIGQQEENLLLRHYLPLGGGSSVAKTLYSLTTGRGLLVAKLCLPCLYFSW